MLSDIDSHEVVAAHEAGHVVIAWDLGLEVVAVGLQPHGGVLASVQFGPGELDRLDARGRGMLVMSGLAGQRLAEVPWTDRHLSQDIEVLGARSKPTSDSGLEDARITLQEYEKAFHLVREAILEGLDNGTKSLDGRQLRKSASDGA